MSRSWTDNQKKAIEARNMQVLVSAAAGSGKTSVLTERVKQILCDTQNPCSVSEILVVTFTRAAATEMRDRIYKAISDEAFADNENADYLRRQMTLLPTADICTMDSFCAKLVREHFHFADVSADFRIFDEKDGKELMKYALKQVVDELYENNEEGFEGLSQMFFSERDDLKLEEVIETLYTYSRSYPSPEKWLNEVVEGFSSDKAPADTEWCRVICKYLSMFAEFYKTRLNRCEALLEESGNFDPNYIRRFTESASNLSALKDLSDNLQWDSIVGIIRNGLVVRPTSRNKNVDKDLQGITDKIFKDFEASVDSLVGKALPTTEEHREDCLILYPAVKVLCGAVKRLTEILDEVKKEKNAYGFDDILHKAIKLLVDFSDSDAPKKTPLAEELTEKYKEILIDEYQDTNKAQNSIFEMISRNKTNLYTVGDVKQSIYGFRLASPDLFMNLKDSMTSYDGSKKPSLITLENNFRSREGVTKTVNAVFSGIMSREMGGIEYNEREYLNYSASFPSKATPDVDIICVNADKKDEDAPTEPATVAKYIKSVVDSGVTISTPNGARRVRWGDFCILLRSAKSKVGVYGEELKKLSIPVSASTDNDCSQSKEIQFLTSLVKVVNNPLIDIPLISVMVSAVFGFTPDELAEIRLIDKKADFYACLVKYAEHNEKARAFLNKIQLYRNISAAYPVDEFVKFIVNDTAVADIYYASGEGDLRNANVKGFVKLATDFCENGRTGLSDFVRYIDIAVERGALKGAGSSFEDDSVKIMSIHKSKGLEFPYVIVADCSKSFNRQDAYKQLTLSKTTGIGMQIRDDERFTRYHTLSSVATEKSVLFDSISEELRVFYVAMTRAKEHLTFFCNVAEKSLRTKVQMNHFFSKDSSGRLKPYEVYAASSMSEWLLSSLSHHRDAAVIRDLCEIPSHSFNEESDFSFDCSYIESNSDGFTVSVEDCESAPVNQELLSKIKENIEYTYPYDFSGILAKRSASSTESNQGKREFFGRRKPAFLNEKMDGADRGTAVHKFLELCDFNSAKADLQAEKARLKNAGLVTDAELQVLDDRAVECFINSDVGRRLLSSSQVLKEYEFAILKNAEELYPDLPENAKNEQIVVQGKLDCAFLESDGYVVIDYKTDNSTNDAHYTETYKNQLAIYADALNQCTNFPVKEVYIYSFKMQKFIKI